MKVYLKNKKVYVQNEDKLIYQIKSYEGCDDALYFQLELVCGWKNNEYQLAENFSEDVQTETVIQYFLEESALEALELNNYTIIQY